MNKKNATNPFEAEYPTFQNLNKRDSNNLNDDSYISSNSGLNLLASGGLDNSLILNGSDLNLSGLVNGQRVINNNYSNIVNMR